jgi:hypothetical protein
MSKKENSTTEKSINIWSENTRKWTYVPKDPSYFRIKYYAYVRPKPCNICGCIINTQMLRHYRCKKCQLVRAGITNAVVKLENAISPFKMENNDSPAFTSQSSASAFTVEHQKNVERYVEKCFTQYEHANSGKHFKFLNAIKHLYSNRDIRTITTAKSAMNNKF